MEGLIQYPRSFFNQLHSLTSLLCSRKATTLKSLQAKRSTKWSHRRDPSKPRRTFRPRPLLKPTEVNPTAKWSSMYQTARAYDPYLITMPIRMGRPGPGELPPAALGNVELLKIPNFFHLTPSAIDKQCKALKPLCTDWPGDLSHLKMHIHTRNYVFPANSLRHPSSRKVKISVNLSQINFRDDYAQQKMIDLVGERYNPQTNILTLASDRCPTRKQNKEYLIYLLKVLYLESHKMEPWDKPSGNSIERIQKARSVDDVEDSGTVNSH